MTVDDEERHRLRSVRHRALRLLRRQPQGRQSVREQPRRARREDRKAPVALPDHPSRSVGLRSSELAQAADRASQRDETSTSLRRPPSTGSSSSSIGMTGEPLWPIEERPVPQSDVPGEYSSPTQPFPTKPPPFARQSFTEKDINPFIPEAEKQALREAFKGWRNEGLFTPPSLQGFDPDAGPQRRHELGRSAVDPAERHDVRRLERAADADDVIVAPGGARGGGVGGGAAPVSRLRPAQRGGGVVEARGRWCRRRAWRCRRPAGAAGAAAGAAPGRGDAGRGACRTRSRCSHAAPAMRSRSSRGTTLRSSS